MASPRSSFVHRTARGDAAKALATPLPQLPKADGRVSLSSVDTERSKIPLVISIKFRLCACVPPSFSELLSKSRLVTA
eukprot:4885922-Amphidinium_carterae.1